MRAMDRRPHMSSTIHSIPIQSFCIHSEWISIIVISRRNSNSSSTVQNCSGIWLKNCSSEIPLLSLARLAPSHRSSVTFKPHGRASRWCLQIKRRPSTENLSWDRLVQPSSLICRQFLFAKCNSDASETIRRRGGRRWQQEKIWCRRLTAPLRKVKHGDRHI